MNKVTVLGSLNVDTTLRVKQMPKPGETMHTSELFNAGGGKGANQAVAAARSKAKTAFIGALGNDAQGDLMKHLMEVECIDIQGITIKTEEKTGQAYIMVDDQGENSILVHGGANMALSDEDVVAAEAIIADSDFLISQFECSMDSVLTGFKLAKNNNVITILNPAPACEKISEELLAVTDILIPNETEAEIITGIKIVDQTSLDQAVKMLHELGIKVVIITLGSKGAFYDIAGKSGLVPAFKVDAVDTTAAGDTFIGAMSSVLKTDFSNIESAIIFGNKASSITVTQYGAQPSIPTKEMIEK